MNSLTAETLFRRLQAPSLPLDPTESVEAPLTDQRADRRVDIEGKQARLAEVLKEVDCEGLLVLDPENFAWLTSGGTARGVINPGEMPVLFFSPEQRWVICSNADTQRLFDDELDGLGFQLKEWPWHWGREQLLADLCEGRNLATDQAHGEAKLVASQLRGMRRTLTKYEQACYRALGQTVSHALEATCRNISVKDTEREIAGHLGHRLLHRGVLPLSLGVAADGRSRKYRQYGFTATPVMQYAILQVTAKKYGLCVSANRGVTFGPVPEDLRREHNGACRVSASYLASTWPDAVPREILKEGRRIYQLYGFEHEWPLAPQGWVTGRSPVEQLLLPTTEELFHPDWAVTWNASVGAAASCDSFLLQEEGPLLVTPTEQWPVKRIRIQGAEFVRPDLLER